MSGFTEWHAGLEAGDRVYVEHERSPGHIVSFGDSLAEGMTVRLDSGRVVRCAWEQVGPADVVRHAGPVRAGTTEPAAGTAWAVISPAGELAWYPLAATRDVEAIVSGEYAPDALDYATVTLGGPLRVMASDIALLAPEHYAPNPVAQRVITGLSGGRIVQPWRGHVALVEYERDSGPGSIGEWLWPGEMSPEWIRRVTAAVAAARTVVSPGRTEPGERGPADGSGSGSPADGF